MERPGLFWFCSEEVLKGDGLEGFSGFGLLKGGPCASGCFEEDTACAGLLWLLLEGVLKKAGLEGFGGFGAVLLVDFSFIAAFAS